MMKAGGGNLPIDALMQRAVTLHQAGELEQAERVYCTILEQRPNEPHATHYLGLLALQRGDAATAVALIQRAITIESAIPEFYINLGNAEKRTGNVAGAEAAYRSALSLRPGLFAALFNLALLQESAGDYPAALDTLQETCRRFPEAVGVLTSMARVLRLSGRWQDARAFGQRAIDSVHADADAYRGHGELLMALDEWRAAERCLRKAAKRFTGRPDVLNALGCALDGLQCYSEAVDCFRQAVAVQETFAPAWANLATALRNQGRIDDALAAYDRAIALSPADASVHSARLFALLMADHQTPEVLQRAHATFAELAPVPPAYFRSTGGERADLSRRLRIGYLSGDLRRHPVGYFMGGVLSHHNPQNVEVYCYSTGTVEDEFSDVLCAKVAHWVRCGHLDDRALAARIRDDRIDVLIDLSGHTAHNRLLMMALRPAPVQVSYLGYAHTLNLPWIDFRISDSVADPPGDVVANSAERIVRLPGSYYCYSPPVDMPSVAPAPGLRNGRLTFGAFLQLGKLSPCTRDLWARVMRELPESRLLLRAKGLADRGTREAIREDFMTRGIARSRLEFEGWSNYREHLQAYARVDCMLDTLPFNLATNTCEALWMGVPTVTLCGDRHPARMGASILAAAGLPGFIARDADEFVSIAKGVAADLAELAVLREGLRSRLADSALLASARQARALERLYRAMWLAGAGRESGGGAGIGS